MKFIADFMLGRLARWLRILGYDTEYIHSPQDENIILRSLTEGRIILTRNKKVSKKKALKIVYIESDYLKEQMKQLISELNLKIDKNKIFTRCLECNSKLEIVSKEKIKERVPKFVYQTQDVFSICPECKKIYWRGTHFDLVNQKINSFI